MVPATYLNHWHVRLRAGRGAVRRLARPPDGALWLNLGSGARPHPSLVNIDVNVLRRPDMWLDVRHGLPFPDSSVDGIYSCHLFEHLYWAEASFVARECRRVLRPGAGIRLLVPSLEMAIDAYREGRLNWFSDFPHPFQSPGGRLVNFLFCDGQHRLAFDHSFATELLTLAGFADIRRVAPRVGAVLPTRLLQELEPEVGYTETSLVVEAFVRR